MASASRFLTGRPWITSRTASSVILPLTVRGMSATWITLAGTWRGLVLSRIRLRILATNDRQRIRREVLTKLNAAKGGGYIVQSDHSVPDNVDPAGYDYLIELVRRHGRYPLDLGEFDRQIE